jgi:hypothetical protein
MLFARQRASRHAERVSQTPAIHLADLRKSFGSLQACQQACRARSEAAVIAAKKGWL